MADLQWTEKQKTCVLALADGKTVKEAAELAGVGERTLWRWKTHPAFSAELDRLTLMVGIASRAERLRIAQRVVRQRVKDDAEIISDRDLLDWLKFAQSETDGVKLDLTVLAQSYDGNR